MQWLDIRLQLMGAAVVSAIAVIALVQHQKGLANPGTTVRPITLTLGAGHSRSLTQTPPTRLPLSSCTAVISYPVSPVRMLHQSHHHPHFSAEESMGRGGSGTKPRLLRSSFPCFCLPHYSIQTKASAILLSLLLSTPLLYPIPLHLWPATLHCLLLQVDSNPSLSSAHSVTCSPMLGSSCSPHSLPHTCQCVQVSPSRWHFSPQGWWASCCRMPCP